MRRFNDYTTPSSSGTEVLRSLQRDAERDRGWFQKYFNPTREEKLEQAERMARPNLVERLVCEHPWIVLGPAGLMWKPVHAALQRAGAIALQRVTPMILAATAEAGNYVYKNLIHYAKGGKDAVGKGGKGAGGSGKGSGSKGRPDSGRVVRDHSDVKAFFESPGNELRYLGTRNVKGRNTKIYGDKDGNRYYEDTVHL
jgi:hypothetical protein